MQNDPVRVKNDKESLDVHDHRPVRVTKYEFLRFLKKRSAETWNNVLRYVRLTVGIIRRLEDNKIEKEDYVVLLTASKNRKSTGKRDGKRKIHAMLNTNVWLF